MFPYKVYIKNNMHPKINPYTAGSEGDKSLSTVYSQASCITM